MTHQPFDPARAGSLTVVGTGYRLLGHLTLESISCIENAQKLLYLVGDPVMREWMTRKNGSAESLLDCYAAGKPRSKSYKEMIERILGYVRQGLDVTVAAYGHPGVFAYPTHASVRLARREGYRAVMLPGVSAEDCLFAEIGVDPARHGCQSYEATDFLNRRPRFDPTSALILWQVTLINEDSVPQHTNMEGLRELASMLTRHYPNDHRVVLYQTSNYPVCEPVIVRVPLKGLARSRCPPMATLYVPPCRGRVSRA